MYCLNAPGFLVVLLLLSACESPESSQEQRPSDVRAEVAAEKSRQADTPQAEGNERALQYEILEEDEYDSPIKTQVQVHAVVEGGITELALRRTAGRLYEATASRQGFEFHDNPTHVAVYLYTSRENYEGSMGAWVAMLTRLGTRAPVELSVREQALADANASAQSRHGLSRTERREVFREIAKAEDRAWTEADDRHPLPDPSSREYTPDRLRVVMERQGATRNRLTREYKAEVAGDYGLSLEQLRDIGNEGIEKHWPMP